MPVGTFVSVEPLQNVETLVFSSVDFDFVVPPLLRDPRFSSSLSGGLSRDASTLGDSNLDDSNLLSRREATWLILPVVICLSQRLSHACLSTCRIKAKPRMAH